jgi:hypothetical protein
MRCPASTQHRSQQCYSCCKWFFSVARHWSSPYSRCRPLKEAKRKNEKIKNLFERPPSLQELDSGMEGGSDDEIMGENYDECDPTSDTEGSLLSIDQLDSGHVYGSSSTKWVQQLRKERDPTNPFFPFATKTEWELAWWATRIGLSRQDMDDFFHMDLVCLLCVSSLAQF